MMKQEGMPGESVGGKRDYYWKYRPNTLFRGSRRRDQGGVAGECR